MSCDGARVQSDEAIPAEDYSSMPYSESILLAKAQTGRRLEDGVHLVTPVSARFTLRRVTAGEAKRG